MSNDCYLCGKEDATQPLKLKDTFTAHNLAKAPTSDKLCTRCEWSIGLRANYYQEAKKKYSTLYSRNWSWLYQGDRLLFPTFNGEYEGLPIVENLPSREMIRGWLIDPPDPPFTIAIAESGQKHILFLAPESCSKELMVIQFELDTMYVDRKEYIKVLGVFEELMTCGCTKTEITTGSYKSQTMLNLWEKIIPLDDKIAKYRGGRFLDLISYVAINTKSKIKIDKEKQEPIPTKSIKEKSKKIRPSKKQTDQLNLFYL